MTERTLNRADERHFMQILEAGKAMSDRYAMADAGKNALRAANGLGHNPESKTGPIFNSL